ncbi:hypothetical protein LC613_41175 [Nostoc sphaeroides CHAB 2801]|uniref:hypothetical protein n=1 Tax=Nostoc sphaeroides TaxID=446679 RepID=UPI001E3C6A03|nr:hypothetical protein [Nostoc sphaeroides]MCC5633833.1 hypothetical protein [Nostoc sphaeroides CHAB 2801]
MAKNEDLGVEPGASHEDAFSAAPIVPNFGNLSQPQNQAQRRLSASLLVESQELGEDAISPIMKTQFPPRLPF